MEKTQVILDFITNGLWCCIMLKKKKKSKVIVGTFQSSSALQL